MRHHNDIKTALAAISAAKWRSFLTMLGVIIGVASVVTIISLGEGVKHQLIAQIKHTGSDLITIRGGKIVDYDEKGNIKKTNLFNLLTGNALSDADFKTIQKISDSQLAAPFAVVNGVPTSEDGKKVESIDIIATNHQAAQALGQDVPYGGFFEEKDNKMPVAIIGKDVAVELFNENKPIGKSFELRGKIFMVRGVFEQFQASPLTPGIDYNNTIFIPYDYSKDVLQVTPHIYQILVKPGTGISAPALAKKLRTDLLAAHGGQSDFTVLEAKDSIAVASNLLNLLTALVSAVAGVSLVVGGIGIMNIMLVAVSERTHEIGIRKSIGATNRQILNQFIIEAIVLSVTGGFVGVLVSLLINYLLRVFTSLQPVVTLPVMASAVVLALIVGTFFGAAPALKAARKDPIEALRRI